MGTPTSSWRPIDEKGAHHARLVRQGNRRADRGARDAGVRRRRGGRRAAADHTPSRALGRHRLRRPCALVLRPDLVRSSTRRARKLVNYPDRLCARREACSSPRSRRAMPTVSPDGTDVHLPACATTSSSRRRRTSASTADALQVRDRPSAATDSMNSPAQPFLGDIVGAEDVIDGTTNSTPASSPTATRSGSRSCSRRATFSLGSRCRSSARFPLSVPIDPDGIDAPVPSAGPYYIDELDARTSEIVLKENPNYTRRRPHHFDEIRFAIGLPLETIKLRIETGEDGLGRPSALRRTPSLAALYGPCERGSIRRPAAVLRATRLRRSST